MQLVEILFFGIIAVSITVSLYLISSFLMDIRKQREEWEYMLVDKESITVASLTAEANRNFSRRDLTFERQRRLQLATPEPDLVLVQRGRFAAVVLPLATDSDTYEAIQCRLCMN